MKFAELTSALIARPASSRGLYWNLLLLVWGGVLLAAISHSSLLNHSESRSTYVAHQVSPLFMEHEHAYGQAERDALFMPPWSPTESVQADRFEWSRNDGFEVPQTVDSETSIPRPTDDDRIREHTAEEVGEDYVRQREQQHESVEDRYGVEHPVVRTGSRPVQVPSYSGSLRWLKDHQNREGYWSAANYRADSVREAANTDSGSEAASHAKEDDVAVTALALLAFTGHGYDHKDGSYRATCRQALLWLRKITNSDGSIDGVYGIQTYSWVALAWCECYGLSGDAVLRPLAERAVQYLFDHRYEGSGWGIDDRYHPDLVSTATVVLALTTAKMAGVELDTDALYADVKKYLDRVAGDAHPSNRQPLEAACWITTALWTGHADLKDSRIIERANLLASEDHLPAWHTGRIDFTYWWFGSLALYQIGGDQWKKWEKSVTQTLFDNQRGYSDSDKKQGWTNKEELDEHGSWDPVDPWNTHGRVFSTAVSELTLQIYYRYLRLSDE